MFAAVRLFPALSQRVRILMVAAILALSLTVGMANTTTKVSAMPPQPKVQCLHYSRVDWYWLTGEDSGRGGFWDCDFV
jgi:hypothetical protein